MPLKAILFDMDGVIVDTEPLHRKAYFRMFSELGIEVTETFYAPFTGCSTQNVCSNIVEHYRLGIGWEELAEMKRRYFKEFFDTDPDFNLLPDVLQLIEHYYQNGIKLVLASSAHINTINWVFEKFNLERYFIGKISGAELNESKPNPEIFIKAAILAREEIENCMVIEDSTNGILAAYRAGMFCVAYRSMNSKLQDYSKANIIVNSFSELRLNKIEKYFL